MKKLIALLVIAFISGCTTKLAYKNLDWVIAWYLDDYIELNESQSLIFDKKLATWLAWHKKYELPQYLTQLKEIARDVSEQNITVSRITYHQNALFQHWWRLKQKVVPDLVDMASSLTKPQVEQLLAALKSRNDERLEKYHSLSLEEKKEKPAKRFKKTLTAWLGELTAEQSRIIEVSFVHFNPTFELWLGYQGRFQQALKSLLTQENKDETFKSSLYYLLMHPEIYRGELLDKRRAENSLKYKVLLSEIFLVDTAEQREDFIAEINEYTQDITALLAD